MIICYFIVAFRNPLDFLCNVALDGRDVNVQEPSENCPIQGEVQAVFPPVSPENKENLGQTQKRKFFIIDIL